MHAESKRPPSSRGGCSTRFGHRCSQRRQKMTESPKPKVTRSKTSGKNVGTENPRKAVKRFTTGNLPSIAIGVEQYGLSPTVLKTISKAACSGVGGYQACSVTAIEIGTGQQHTPPSQRASAIILGGSVSGTRTANCTNLFRRLGSGPILHSDTPSVV